MTPKPEKELNSHGVHSLEYISLQGGLDRAVLNLEDKLAAQEKLFDSKIELLKVCDGNLEKSVLLAIKGVEKHQEASNNLQHLLREQEQENAKRLERYVPMSEYQTYNRKLEGDIRALELSRAEISGKATAADLAIVSERANRAFIVSAILAVVSAVSLAFSIARFFIH